MVEFDEIFSHVIMNWDNIITDPCIARVLDIGENKLYKKIKSAHPQMMDQLIQAYVASLLFLTLYTICCDQSVESVGTVGMVGSAGSVGTVESAGSMGSVGSMGMVGTVGTVGTVGSMGMVGSVGTAGSVELVDSILTPD